MNKRKLYKKPPQENVACCPCIRLKMDDIDGVEREAQERISYDNKNIDPKRSDLNLYIHGLDEDNKPIINNTKYSISLKERITIEVEYYGVKIRQNKGNRMVDEQKVEKGHNTKESVVAEGIIFQLSHELAMKLLKEDGMLDEEGMIIKGKQLPHDSKTYKYFEDTYLFACKRWGKERIVGAYIHMDEYTPHMHLFIVPLDVKVRKYKKRDLVDAEGNPNFWFSLNAKKLFSKESIKQLWADYGKEMGKYGARAATGLIPKGAYDKRTSMDAVRAREEEEKKMHEEELAKLKAESIKERQELEETQKHVKDLATLFAPLYNYVVEDLQQIMDKIKGKGTTKVHEFEVKEDERVAVSEIGVRTPYLHREYKVFFQDMETGTEKTITVDQDDYYQSTNDSLKKLISQYFFRIRDKSSLSLASKTKKAYKVCSRQKPPEGSNKPHL